MKSATQKVHTSPQIQPQAKGNLLTYSFRIDHETEDQLQDYVEFIHSDRSHMIREALRFLFRNDSQLSVTSTQARPA